jgi:hypothetical protein
VSQSSGQHTPSGLTAVAVLGVLLWAAAAYFVFVYVPSYRCQGDLCGLGLIGPAYVLGGGATLLSVAAAVWALCMALGSRNRLAAASLGLLLASAVFAAYALLQNGHPGHLLVAAVYGFPPDSFGLHPVAFACSVALLAALAPVALGYSLTDGKLRQLGAAAVVLSVLAIWVAVRLVG